MYKDYFRLREMPFSIAPDPRFLYMSVRHREALAHLIYGVQGEGGIVLLTGEVGTGKTTLCRCLLEEIHSRCDVAFILNPRLSAEELLGAVCDEFHIENPAGPGSVKGLVDAINLHLLEANARGRRNVLIIDEAQNLQPDVLEQLRLLTNLETNTRKLLQIILIGQPELQEMLSRPELRQVAQRVVARYHLTHLARAEVAGYVAHRLRISGAQAPIFPDALIGKLYRVTGGVPRLINLVCDRALLGTYVQGRLQVTPKTLRNAATEALGASGSRLLGWQLALGAALCGGGVLAASFVAGPLWPPDWAGPEWLGLRGAPTPRPVAAAAPGASVEAEVAAPGAAAVTKTVATAEALSAIAAVSSKEVGAATRASAEASVAPDQAVGEGAKPAAAVETLASTDAAAAAADGLHWSDQTAPRARSERIAFRDLFRLRGLAYDPGEKRSPCKAAEAFKLRCHYGRGGLADVRRINQPVVLRMDGDGKVQPYYVVLAGLNESTAIVIVAGTTRSVSLAGFGQLWSGTHVLLWDAPPGYTGAMVAGSRGPAVLWLRHALARLQGGNFDGPAVFDEDLIRRVKTFQFSEGMVPDGVAGELTLIRMNMRLDEKLPRLASIGNER